MRRMSTTKQQEIFKYLVQNGNTTEAGGNLYVDGNAEVGSNVTIDGTTEAGGDLNVGGNLSIDGYSNTGSLTEITETITTTDWDEDDLYTIPLPRNINIKYMYFESSIGTNIYIPLYLSGRGILFRDESQASVVLTPTIASMGGNFGWQASGFAVNGISIEAAGPDSENYIQFAKLEDSEYMQDVRVNIVYSQDNDTNYEV